MPEHYLPDGTVPNVHLEEKTHGSFGGSLFLGNDSMPEFQQSSVKAWLDLCGV